MAAAAPIFCMCVGTSNAYVHTKFELNRFHRGGARSKPKFATTAKSAILPPIRIELFSGPMAAGAPIFCMPVGTSNGYLSTKFELNRSHRGGARSKPNLLFVYMHLTQF